MYIFNCIRQQTNAINSTTHNHYIARQEEIKNRLVIIMNSNKLKTFTVNLSFWVSLFLRMTKNIIPFNLQLNIIIKHLEII